MAALKMIGISSNVLAATFDFTTFFTLAFLEGHTLLSLHSLAVFGIGNAKST